MEKQRCEIISEDQVRRLPEKDKLRVGYHSYVELDDKISIDHYKGDIRQELVKPASGTNPVLSPNDNKKGGRSLVSRSADNNSLQNPKSNGPWISGEGGKSSNFDGGNSGLCLTF